MISDNIKTWLNYSKTKGTANVNIENQHRVISMELRVKFRKTTNHTDLQKHIQFDINALRENETNLQIPEGDESRKTIETAITILSKEKWK